MYDLRCRIPAVFTRHVRAPELVGEYTDDLVHLHAVGPSVRALLILLLTIDHPVV